MEKPSQTHNNPVEEAPPTKRRKTMVRFTDELDFQLIQEAQARNPYGKDYGKKTQAWADVAAALEVDVDGRRCRERCNQLVDAYEAKQKASEKRSGPCEEYTPKDECLAEFQHSAAGMQQQSSHAQPQRGCARCTHQLQQIASIAAYVPLGSVRPCDR
ncbi:hypothetical protein PHYSODRAFT_325763 [Phytophthora sojae]|uniref:MADF domain-containing protein n=1 Tax=Phytophthora sojae (strain P6497) TaxID=1094619 RepID=G4Z0B2_PHYSP|nr:hypothetical protein PHYSODRAFT_325763 [Phytophthora sojae]EGZ24669.1 hypothetical protein PHYSODRAFT_325763 [Phytophthora sojae]|eukprot:XP_009519957.1 hypothetical protein PHYSODRAFT_325763 [Phytophthora sojae]